MSLWGRQFLRGFPDRAAQQLRKSINSGMVEGRQIPYWQTIETNWRSVMENANKMAHPNNQFISIELAKFKET
jgi:hypothetical protein